MEPRRAGQFPGGAFGRRPARRRLRWRAAWCAKCSSRGARRLGDASRQHLLSARPGGRRHRSGGIAGHPAGRCGRPAARRRSARPAPARSACWCWIWRGMIPGLPLGRRRAGCPEQAIAHGALVLCLTIKTERQPSLGSLVTVRGQARRVRRGDGEYACRVEVLKDKRRGPRLDRRGASAWTGWRALRCGAPVRARTIGDAGRRAAAPVQPRRRAVAGQAGRLLAERLRPLATLSIAPPLGGAGRRRASDGRIPRDDGHRRLHPLRHLRSRPAPGVHRAADRRDSRPRW